MDNYEKLKQFKELLDAGVITQEEFDKMKEELLSAFTADPVPQAAPSIAAGPANAVPPVPTGKGTINLPNMGKTKKADDKKKIVMIAAIVAFALILVILLRSCGSVKQDKIVGTWDGSWVYDGKSIEVVILFEADGSFTKVAFHNGSANNYDLGTYEIKGKKVILHSTIQSGQTTEYKYKGGKLVNNGYKLEKIN